MQEAGKANEKQKIGKDKVTDKFTSTSKKAKRSKSEKEKQVKMIHQWRGGCLGFILETSMASGPNMQCANNI